MFGMAVYVSVYVNVHMYVYVYPYVSICSAYSTTHHPPAATTRLADCKRHGVLPLHSTQAPREQDLEFLSRVGQLYFHVRIVLRECVGTLQVPRLHDCATHVAFPV